MGFFDKYPLYYDSKVAAAPDRLNHRYRAIIGRNKRIIKNATILDLGAYDGRWSFAAIKSGAKHSTIIEGRKQNWLLNHFGEYDVDVDAYTLIIGDVQQIVPKLPVGAYDVVFCLGILYHVTHPSYFLYQLDALNPKHIIIDTEVVLSDQSMIQVRRESSHGAGSGLPKKKKQKDALVGIPSRKAVNRILRYLGYNLNWYDWSEVKGERMGHYRAGKRVTVLATKK